MPQRPPQFKANGRSREQRQTAAKRAVDARRGNTTQRGYGADWQRLRAVYLQQHPLCECDDCGAGSKRITIAQVVDHRIPIAERPDLRLDPNNLRAMSKRCHDAHTARTQGFARPGNRGGGEKV